MQTGQQNSSTPGILFRILGFFSVILFICLPVNGIELPAGKEAVPIWTDTLGEHSVNVACSDDGRYCVAGADTGTLRLYDISGKTLWTYDAHSRSGMPVAISGDGRFIAASFIDPNAPSRTNMEEVLVFDREGKITGRYLNRDIVRRLALPADGDPILASAASDLLVLNTNGDLRRKYSLNGPAIDISMTSNGRLGAAAVDNGWRTRNGKITFISTENGTLWEFPTQNRAVAVALSPDAKSIIAADENTLYSILPDGTARWNYPSSPRYTDVAVSDDGKIIAAGSQYFLRVFDSNGSLLWKYQDNAYVSAVAVSPSGDRIIAGVPAGKTTLFDNKGNVVWWYNRSALQIAMSRSGDYFLIGAKDSVFFLSRWGNMTIIPPGDAPTGGSGLPPPTTIPEWTAPIESQSSGPASAPGPVSILAVLVTTGILVAMRKR